MLSRCTSYPWLRLLLAFLTSCYVSDVVGKGLEEFVVPGWYCFCLFFAIEMYVLWYCLLLEVRWSL